MRLNNLRLVFLQPPIANLAIAELAFDDTEHVLDFGPHGAVFLVAPLLRGRQNPPRFAFVFHRPCGTSRPGCPFALVADVALVAEYDRVDRADQIIGQLCVMHLVSASNRAQGTAASISPRKTSRFMRFFLWACSSDEKLRCFIAKTPIIPARIIARKSELCSVLP